MRGAEAVRARVTAADDDDVLAVRGDELAVRDLITLAAPVLQGEVIHRVVDASEVAPRYRQIARLTRAAGEQHRIVVVTQTTRGHVHADVDAGTEHHAFDLHHREAAIEMALLHLELGDAVAEQTADAIRLLEHRDRVAGAIELIGRREARRTRSDDGDLLPGPGGRRTRRHPALVPGAIDDRGLDRLDRDRLVVDAQHTRSFTRRRAQLAGELREVVRRVQPIDRGFPAIAIDEIVPVGNQVAERAALMTERNPAVHAAGALRLELARRVRQVDLAPVPDALGDRARRLLLAVDFDEPGRLTHGRSSPHPRRPPSPRCP